MNNKNEEKKGEPEPEIREKAHDKKRVEEALRKPGIKGTLIRSEKFGYYYFFPDEAKYPNFRIERLYGDER